MCADVFERDVQVVRNSIAYLDVPHYKWNEKKNEFSPIDADGNFIEVHRGRKTEEHERKRRRIKERS